MPPSQSLDGASLAAYYERPAVRARIREYCGFDLGPTPSCVFLSATLPGAQIPIGWTPEPQFPTSELDQLLDGGADIFRSAWDRESLLIHLDIDYLNADRPGHAFARPVEVFDKVEPTYQALVDLLEQYGMNLLPVVTGRGYQLTGCVSLESPLVTRLAALAPRVPDWCATQDRRLPAWIQERLTPVQARAYVGAGLALEYFAHRLIQRAASHSSLPIVLNGTNVGAGSGGREAVSIDLSFAGDPMDMRHMRVAFGGYQLHRFRPDLFGREIAALTPLIAVPRLGGSLDDVLQRHRAPEGAGRLAESNRATIPNVTEGVAALLTDYEPSALRRFHQSFYATEPDPPAAWPRTYDRLDLTTLPPCVAAPLAMPNDLLLKPEHLQHVTRYLMSEGWAPGHVAGLVWSRYEKNFAWGRRWTYLSPRARAEFDVRVFSGMVAVGLDRGIDFNCRSAQEKRLCPMTTCDRDLRVSRQRLLARTA